MVQSLMAIAAFMAVISGVIFGVSRFEKSKQEEESIGLVTVTKPIEKIEPVANVEPVESEPTREQTAEPVEVAEPEAIVEPRSEIAEFMIAPTIQDPKRPNDGKVEDLTQEILAWGQSKDLKHVSKLMQYSTHSDAIVRSHVATSLGQIVGSHPVRGDVERSIPVLGKMTNDSDLKVRLYAVQSLGMIRSEKVLPYLEKALLSPSGSVMQAANTALQNLKLQYGKTPSMQIAQQMLEKIIDRG
jgi:hypothetical protein